MTYDFTTLMDRHGWDAVAVDGLGAGGGAPEPPRAGYDFIPMWVADMNFPVLPSITEAIGARLQQPHFGYFDPRPEYFDRIISWQHDRNKVEGLEPAHIGYENGVLGGVVSTIEAFTAPGDTVLVHSPTYIGFTKSIENAGRHIELSPLKQDENGVWRMDFDDMEKRLSERRIHAAVFCSPHNPCGRVWERWEIERAMQLYKQYDCVVVSDEIWSDIILPGQQHIPTQSVSEDARERTVAFYAPSKTFNLAGLVGSYHIIYNDYLRDRVTAQSSKCHYNEMNVLSMHALIGAYGTEGRIWVDELCQVIEGNIDWACRFIEAHVPGVTVARPQGTYMLFLDCTQWCDEHGCDVSEVLHRGWEVGVGWQDGRPFHGPCHIRMNLALPLSSVQEAFQRLESHVFVD
ncbi:aminotransferase class I/II-fold pyridoxal phosphate-dependent enzyme [Collinsella sp. An2]|uniref:MalY/PatB family protein n=1 Tax=Collinsella sp. An2 TaxID=1965585 RepID=UPI000B3656F1|nr:aminotransferase class I/II-fold pyridoxal phosphate-dependent enzyme [Collinsella sp. An2]OUP07201.1 aspartate aminotransferase [Collinsella sp. An2]